MATAAEIVKEAMKWKGTKEYPPYSNNVIFNTEYYGYEVNDSSYAWCMVFVWYVFKQCGASNLLYDGQRIAGCTTFLYWAQDRGLTVPTDQGRMGDIVLFEGFDSIPGDADHVGIIVERNSDGSYTTIEGNTGSDDADGGAVLERRRYTNIGWIVRPKYSGQGSLESDELVSKFLKTASDHIGDSAVWVRSYVQLAANQGWSAAFIVAVAKVTGGIINKYIYPSTSNSALLQQSVKLKYGEFIEGPYFGESVTPSVGDIIALRTGPKSSYVNTNEYYCEHLGIVREVRDSTLIIIDGDSSYNGKSSVIGIHEYSKSNSCIFGYYHPSWEQAGTIAFNIVNDIEGVYEPFNTEDALVRQCCSITKSGEFTKSNTGMYLSVINYTSAVSSFLSDTMSALSTLNAKDTVDISGVTDGTVRTCLQYLLDKSLTITQSIGVVAYLYGMTHCHTDFNDGTGIGIASWTGDIKSKLQTTVQHWQSNLTGQLDLLWWQLCTKFQLDKLTHVTGLKVEDARNATEIVFDMYNKSGLTYRVEYSLAQKLKLAECQNHATRLYSQCIIVPATVGGQGIIKTNSGQILNTGKEVLVPDSLSQTGLVRDYTVYPDWYWDWSSGTNQQALARIWDAKGRQSSRNIATIDGYYLCAFRPVIGTTGDIITVVLEDGTTFTTIQADTKGSDAQNEWGHVYGGAVSLVEWECTDPDIDLSGWEGKRVAKCINYGSYLS